MRFRNTVLVVLLGFAVCAWGSDRGRTAKLPRDPQEMLALAWQTNGLHGSDLKPWHVLATWQALDEHGKWEPQGSLEEWWAGPEKIRMDLHGPGFHQTRWVTANGEFSTGDPGWPAWIYTIVANTIVKPLPSESALKEEDIQYESHEDLSLKLQCAIAGQNPGSPWKGRVEYCFNGGLTAVREEIQPQMKEIFDGVVQFQDRYLARDIDVVRLGMPNLWIHLQKVEMLNGGEASEFIPPSDAAVAAMWQHEKASGRTRSPKAITERTDHLRNAGAHTHVQGMVVLYAVLGEDGSLHNIEVVDGPPALQQAAIDDARTWRYTPYLFDGKPSEAGMEIQLDWP